MYTCVIIGISTRKRDILVGNLGLEKKRYSGGKFRFKSIIENNGQNRSRVNALFTRQLDMDIL